MHAALRWWSTAAQLTCSDKYGAIVDRLDWLQPSVGSHHHLSSCYGTYQFPHSRSVLVLDKLSLAYLTSSGRL